MASLVGTILGIALTVGFLTGISWLVIADLASALRKSNRSFPQPQTDEPSR